MIIMKFGGTSVADATAMLRTISIDVGQVVVLLELYVDGLAVTAGDGHADCGGSHLDAVVPEYLAGLVDHLHLFLGVSVVEEYVDVGKDVAVDLVGICVGEVQGLLAALAEHLVDAFHTAAGD